MVLIHRDRTTHTEQANWMALMKRTAYRWSNQLLSWLKLSKALEAAVGIRTAVTVAGGTAVAGSVAGDGAAASTSTAAGRFGRSKAVRTAGSPRSWRRGRHRAALLR